MTAKRERPSPCEIEIIHPNYQPSKSELEEDMRIDATFEEAIQALVRSVRVRYIPRRKPR